MSQSYTDDGFQLTDKSTAYPTERSFFRNEYPDVLLYFMENEDIVIALKVQDLPLVSIGIAILTLPENLEPTMKAKILEALIVGVGDHTKGSDGLMDTLMRDPETGRVLVEANDVLDRE